MSGLLGRVLRGEFQRGQRGLYGGKKIMSGNNVSFSNRKTRRTWKPNVHTKSFWSDVLRRRVRTRVTASVLRTMDKMGGFDEYILRTRPDKLDSQFAEDLRSLMNKMLHRGLHLYAENHSVGPHKVGGGGGSASSTTTPFKVFTPSAAASAAKTPASSRPRLALGDITNTAGKQAAHKTEKGLTAVPSHRKSVSFAASAPRIEGRFGRADNEYEEEEEEEEEEGPCVPQHLAGHWHSHLDPPSPVHVPSAPPLEPSHTSDPLPLDLDLDELDLVLETLL